MLLNYSTKTEVEKLTGEITEVGPGIWGCVATVIALQAYMSDYKLRKPSFYTLFIAK